MRGDILADRAPESRVFIIGKRGEGRWRSPSGYSRGCDGHSPTLGECAAVLSDGDSIALYCAVNLSLSLGSEA